MKKFSYQFRVPWGGERHGDIHAEDIESATKEIRNLHHNYRLINLKVKEITK